MRRRVPAHPVEVGLDVSRMHFVLAGRTERSGPACVPQFEYVLGGYVGSACRSAVAQTPMGAVVDMTLNLLEVDHVTSTNLSGHPTRRHIRRHLLHERRKGCDEGIVDAVRGNIDLVAARVHGRALKGRITPAR